MDDETAAPAALPDPPLQTSAGSLPGLPDVLVGHATAVGHGWLTGTTVVLPPAGTVGAVAVAGGGPGTRETDALAPGTLVSTVDAVVLSGGSAYGLAAADGAVAWCEQAGRGFVVSPPGNGPVLRVPIVPAAVVFDLGRGGDPRARPGAAFGWAACAATARLDTDPVPVPEGPVGAGTGARVSSGTAPGGVGAAAAQVAGHRLAVLVVANAAGTPTGGLRLDDPAGPGDRRPDDPRPDDPRPPGLLNTTLAVVVTDAVLDVAAAHRLARAAHAGLARAVDPSHTLVDGDVVFVLATGTGRAPTDARERVGLEATAAGTLTEAFDRAVAWVTP